MTARPDGVVPAEWILQRVRGEFFEMPGLRLTRRQAQRLWNLDEATCAAVLETLIESGFLTRIGDDLYMRPVPNTTTAPRFRMAKAVDPQPPLAADRPRAARRPR